MSLTRLMKSNHGTSDDQCPSEKENMPPQAPRLVCMGNKTIADGEGLHHHGSICKVF